MFKGDDADVNDFKKRVGGSTAKGLPKFDPNRGVRYVGEVQCTLLIP